PHAAASRPAAMGPAAVHAAPAAPVAPAPAAAPPRVPSDVAGGADLVTIRALGDIPPFVGPDMQTYLLKAGDVATVPKSIANLLVKRAKAAMVQEGASDK
ncbi:MAG TPA: hypothetical protein VI796_07090, partial [Candidatus Thermoplasmatota archaeon]|nr:hypothetical protein [Candidatus Thermoplasmatota archaeon]